MNDNKGYKTTAPIMSAPFIFREEEAKLAHSNKKVKDICHAEFDGNMKED